MYLFLRVLVRVHLYGTYPQMFPAAQIHTRATYYLSNSTEHGDRKTAQMGWTALDRTVLWTLSIPCWT